MNKTTVAIIIIVAIAIAALLFLGRGSRQPLATNTQQLTTMLLTSPSFENNGSIPTKFTCDGSTLLTAGGGDINPELHIQNVPDGAKSLALIMHDPDAPRAGGFTHWLVWNMDPKTAIIKQESGPPGGVEGKNDFGRTGYGGPCPPSGTHRYFFKLYALDAMLNLSEGASKKELEAEIQKHLIEKTELVGLYER